MGKWHAPKVVHAYPNANPARCIVQLFEKYVNLLPKTEKNASLYMRPKHKIQPKQWYEDIGLGINTISPIVKRLCLLAGFKQGKFEKFVNHSCRSKLLTRMFGKNQDEQIIMEVGGHRFVAGVRMYKHTSDKIRCQASAAIQGAIKVGEDILVCDENGNIIKSNEAENSESEVFEANPKAI